MKKIILTSLAIIASIVIFAQAPQGFAYQGIARNNLGNPISNQLISIRASILDSSVNGIPKYIETQSVTTSNLGLFSVSIGMGAVQLGTFSAIPWGEDAKFMKVEFDPAGGTSYILSGTQQILSVPYALNALNAKTYIAGAGVSVSGSTITNTAPNQTVTLLPGGATSISGSYPTYTISSPITPSVTLTGSGSTSVTGTYPNYSISSPRIISGATTAAFTPVLISGSGFTTTRVSAGYYNVTFTTPFTTAPTVVASPYYQSFSEASNGINYFVKHTNVTTTGFTIFTQNGSGYIDNIGFSFIATGN